MTEKISFHQENKEDIVMHQNTELSIENCKEYTRLF